MGKICPIYKDQCLGNGCKFWRADAKVDKDADTIYELGTGECMFIRFMNNYIH